MSGFPSTQAAIKAAIAAEVARATAAYEPLNEWSAQLLASGEETISRLLTSTAVAPNGSGSLHFTYWTARKSEVCNNIAMVTGSSALGAVTTLARMGVYSVDGSGNLALLAACNNDTTLFAALSTRYQRALTTPFTKVAGTRYAAAVLVVSTNTLPSLLCPNVGSGLNFGNINSATPVLSTSLPGQADLPNTVLVGALSANARHYYTEFLP